MDENERIETIALRKTRRSKFFLNLHFARFSLIVLLKDFIKASHAFEEIPSLLRIQVIASTMFSDAQAKLNNLRIFPFYAKVHLCSVNKAN